MDQKFGAVAVIERENRQRFEGDRLKAVDGALTGLTKLALVGDLGEPLADLAIDVGQILAKPRKRGGKRTRRPSCSDTAVASLS